MRNFLKVAAGIFGAAATVGVVATLFTFAAIGQANEWCELECGSYQNCDSPFDGLDVCADIHLAAQQHAGAVLSGDGKFRMPLGDVEPPVVFVKFTNIGGRGAIFDSFGRELTGVRRGQHSAEVGYFKQQRPCNTALRHEVRHLLLPPPHDPNHQLPHWEVFDGCAQSHETSGP